MSITLLSPTPIIHSKCLLHKKPQQKFTQSNNVTANAINSFKTLSIFKLFLIYKIYFILEIV